MSLKEYGVAMDERHKSKVLLIRSPLIPVLHPEKRLLFYDYYKYGSLYKFFTSEIIGRVDFLNERTHSLYMQMEKPIVGLVSDLGAACVRLVLLKEREGDQSEHRLLLNSSQ